MEHNKDDQPIQDAQFSDESASPVQEEKLPEGHNPDLGEKEAAPAAEPPHSPEEKALREAAEWKDKYFRLYAEFDNYRKRTQRERAEYLAGAGSDVIRDLLPVMDDFERAIRANESLQDIVAVKEGFNLIHLKFRRILEGKGLKAMESDGKIFDVDFHEAITKIPAPDPGLKGKVVDTTERGYLYQDKVLRFAKVVIGE